MSRLNAAVNAINNNNIVAAINVLQAFINAMQAMAGTVITPSETAVLIAAALMGVALGLWRTKPVVALEGAVVITLLWILGVYAIRYWTGFMFLVASPVFSVWLAITAFALIRGRRISS